jgi:DNA-binding winged helix-turn-helix (wHTH) protein/predicted ATPase
MSYRQTKDWREDSQFLFPPFRLDTGDERLWRASQPIVLRPKSFKLLLFLVNNAGKLLTKDTLLDAVWPDTHVSDAVLRGCVREIRMVLDDAAGAPQFIETVPRRGYRFIVQARKIPTPLAQLNGATPHAHSDNGNGSAAGPPDGVVVGRDGELGWLGRSFEAALGGARQLTFVVGDPGIGKTTLVEAFTRSSLVEDNAWIGYGQCVEHYGVGEAYMPLLEALLRLSKGGPGEQIVPVLEKYAPTWLLQMPSLLNAEEIELLKRRTGGVSRERMQRELVEATEMIAARRPLVLVIEDLHWADHSTLELVSMLSSRREPARFMLIGTYRPGGVNGNGHPLRAVEKEVLRHRRAEQLSLSLLTDGAVGDYLRLRFPDSSLPDELAHLVYDRTEGNPLFMVEMANDLIAKGAITQVEKHWEIPRLESARLGTPESLRQLIEREIATLSDEDQSLLEAASVVGTEVAAPSVGAAMHLEAEEVERRCDGLARHSHLLRKSKDVVWPDGTETACYAFPHQLYQEVLYGRISAIRRVRFHQLIGQRIEMAFLGQLSDVAGQLAMHFEAGKEYSRAVHYRELAAQNALDRRAYREAADHLARAVELIPSLPQSVERDNRECALLGTFAPVLRIIEGYTSPAVEAIYKRARELSERVGDRVHLARALHGLWAFNFKLGSMAAAQKIAEEMLSLRKQVPDAAIEARYALAATQSCTGEFSVAYDHAKQGITLYDPVLHQPHVRLYGQEPGVFLHLWASINSWFLGYPDRALKHNANMRALAERLGCTIGTIPSLYMSAVLHQLRREPKIALERAAAAAALADEQGLASLSTRVRFMRGWALSMEGQIAAGIGEMRHSLSALDAIDDHWYRPYNLALLADALGRMDRSPEGLDIIEEALAGSRVGGQNFYDSELYRLQGELILQGKHSWQRRRHQQTEAEGSFNKAINIAHRAGARSLQLRATVSLYRLGQATLFNPDSSGIKKKDARRKLSEIYNWFTTGFDTPDLMDAKELLGLAELS